MESVHYSSKYHLWETPPDLFNEIDQEFGFTLDPCATKETAKCSLFYTPDSDGLKQDWSGHTVFVNPPYGRSISHWIKKCWLEATNPKTTIVALIPARTDTKYFHKYIWDKEKNGPRQGVSIRFLKGRIKFHKGGKPMDSAPFPSMLVIWNQNT